MTVCGDEAGDHEVAVCVDDFVGVEGVGRFSGGHGEDGAVCCDGEIAIDGLTLVGGHGHNASVADDELWICCECGVSQDCQQDEDSAKRG